MAFDLDLQCLFRGRLGLRRVPKADRLIAGQPPCLKSVACVLIR